MLKQIEIMDALERGYRWIHGYRTPSLGMLVRIRDEFGVSTDKLLEGV